ncbi:hypothetical protein GCM10007938_19190 [Vibrio zhanjiangensis]|uniref:Lysyl-tRNA synthetase n=1 Tax=Vibrio zhanjiangensis TaxID=1046128 RepID=A0ABQ6EYN1_9VIBR|nr:DUF6482 family protein [Vibrio zhanjiangensis]GLT18141.1 hypothetical protein GCM10007938_19190 [Vibrio zhanjiangensis]
MRKTQLDKWIHGHHKDNYQSPRVFVIGCSDLSHYLIAVEYKHKLEPIKENDQPIHFESLDLVRDALLKLGVEKAYLRLHSTDDECGAGDEAMYYDVELPLTTH